MSEFSESYHIWTEDAPATVRRIREARLAGLYFPPKGGWLTFVPYGTVPDLTAANKTMPLICATARPVLWYLFAGDHGWGFQLHHPEQAAMGFEAWWDDEPYSDRSTLDLASLAPFLDGGQNLSAFDPLFETMTAQQAFERQPAYRFAEFLKLPEYRWLSPAYIQKEPESYLKRGARKIGRRPKTAGELIPHPPSRDLRLARPDLSAREAFTIIRAQMKAWEPEWLAWCIANSGASLNSSGRLASGNLCWQVTYTKFTEPTHRIDLSLYGKGRLGVSAGQALMPLLGFEAAAESGLSAPLLEDWMDSPEVATVISSFPLTDGLETSLTNTFMSLCPLFGRELLWEVTRRSDWPGRFPYDETRVGYLIDPKTGKIYQVESEQVRYDGPNTKVTGKRRLLPRDE